MSALPDRGGAAPAPPENGAARADRRRALAALAACALLALAWAPGVSMERAWGWDESMHAALPAARIALGLRDGALGEVARAVHDCRQYPFAYPALLGAVQAVTGVSELACRVTGRLVWCAALFGLFLLAREAARDGGAGRGRRSPGPHRGESPGASHTQARAWAGWLALALGALSPLALAYSGSLFLEIPFVAASVFALRAWLRRSPGGPVRRELAAGAWLALAFFTKFNYGLLLGFALALDLLVEAVLAARAGRLRDLARRAAWLALVPAAGLAWWFLLPLPFGPDEAARHREALVAFLAGNTDPSMRVPWSIRAVHWTCFLVPTPRTLALLLLAALATLPRLRERGVRTLWIVLVAGGLPVWLHGFHQDRFLLPGAVPLWCLAGIGLARLLPPGWRARAAVLAALAVAVLAFPARDAWLVVETVHPAPPELADYRRGVLADFRDLRPGRTVPTSGLLRGEYEAYLDLVEREVGPGTRVGWIGVGSAFSPAALHLGLVERGAGAPAVLRADRLDETFVQLGFVDRREWSAEQLREWAARFDLVLATDPIDLTSPARRAFLVRYRDELASSPGWGARRLGTLRLRRPDGTPNPVDVLVLERTE